MQARVHPKQLNEYVHPQQRATVGKFCVGAEEFEEDYRRSLQMA